jgi:hypothetical protein
VSSQRHVESTYSKHCQPDWQGVLAYLLTTANAHQQLFLLTSARENLIFGTVSIHFFLERATKTNAMSTEIIADAHQQLSTDKQAPFERMFVVDSNVGEADLLC